MKCSKCGAELSEDTKFCSYCGHKIEAATPLPVVEANTSDSDADQKMPYIPVNEPAGATSKATNTPKSLSDKMKEKASSKWSGLSTYGKIATVSIAVFALLCLVALLVGKTVTVIIAVVQIVMAVVSILMHKGIIKLEQKKLWLKWLVLAIAILLTVLDVVSYSWGAKKPVEKGISSMYPTEEPQVENEAMESVPTQDYEIDYVDATSFELALNNGSKVKWKIVQFGVNEYKPDSALGINCWSGEHLNFISKEELDVEKGDIIIGRITEEPSKILGSWKIPYEVLSIDYDAEYSETDERTEKSGFDSSTNEIYNLAGYTVEIPKYWKSENKIDGGFQRYAETSGKVAMLQVAAQAETDNSYPVTFDGLIDDNDNMISMIEATAFKDVENYEAIDTGVIKGILYKGTIEDEDSGLTGYGEWFAFASEEDRTWCTLILCQTDNTEYTYTDDFMKIIESIKRVEDDPPETTPTNTAGAPDDWANLLEKHYEEVKKQFEDAGFTNITCVAHEIDYDEDNVFEGSVINIAIGASGEICTFEKGEQWEKNIKIRIDYRVKPAAPDTTKIVLPQEDSKLWKDLDTTSTSTVYYINTDNISNKPSTTAWGSATVTDGVAEYLNYLQDLGFTVSITDTTHKEPYSGYHTYETNFKVSNNDVSWTMYLYIQRELYVEYELDIHMN